MAEAFMKKYPSVVVQTEAAGSRMCARKIIELGVPADIMASSDSAVIRNLLMPQFADFCIDFSSNEMVIMYRKESLYSDLISIDNWYEIIFRKGVEYGHSDPNADPCGYRTMLCWQLAEKYHQVPGLYKKLIANRPLKNIRPKEVDLLALLETGELDYIFIYRSVAEQHGGLYLLLPNEINLKCTELEDFYRTAQVEITGKNPQEILTRKGAPMVYGITIPKTARNPDMAVKFLAFVLGPEGQRIMQENAHPEFKPVLLDNINTLPLKLRPFVQK
jgi:molybdate/tungstate transport system substrate-binding protein